MVYEDITRGALNRVLSATAYALTMISSNTSVGRYYCLCWRNVLLTHSVSNHLKDSRMSLKSLSRTWVSP